MICYFSQFYFVNWEKYKEFFELCDGKCTLCNYPPHEGRRLHLDHDHITGKVRGLLCTRCNWYLHTIENDPEILERIKQYLCLVEDTIKEN